MLLSSYSGIPPLSFDLGFRFKNISIYPLCGLAVPPWTRSTITVILLSYRLLIPIMVCTGKVSWGISLFSFGSTLRSINSSPLESVKNAVWFVSTRSFFCQTATISMPNESKYESIFGNNNSVLIKPSALISNLTLPPVSLPNKSLNSTTTYSKVLPLITCSLVNVP